MSIISWAEQEALRLKGTPMLLEKIADMAQSEAGKKPPVRGIVSLLYGFCGTFLGVMDRQHAASYMQTGFQDLLFSEETKKAIAEEST